MQIERELPRHLVRLTFRADASRRRVFVGIGSSTDLGLFNRDFRFCPVNGHRRSVGSLPKSAKPGHQSHCYSMTSSARATSVDGASTQLGHSRPFGHTSAISWERLSLSPSQHHRAHQDSCRSRAEQPNRQEDEIGPPVWTNRARRSDPRNFVYWRGEPV